MAKAARGIVGGAGAAAFVLALGCSSSDSVAPPVADAGSASDASGGNDGGPLPDAKGDGATATDASDGATESGVDPQIAELHQRADLALDGLLLSYWSAGRSYFVETPGGATDAGYWIFAQAFDALLDGVERTKGEHYAGLVETLYSAQNARGWTRSYYDDENWMALALTRAFDLLGTKAYLAEAEALLVDIMAAWDTTCCGASPGGIWWSRAHTQKATASNAGPVILAVRLSERTGKASYLAFAKQVYAFWLANMVDPTTRHVRDHIDTTGAVPPWTFTYNEGLMIGAAAELARVSGDPQYLADANGIADFMVANETVTNVNGATLSDGANAVCTGDRAAFKGIGARYLALLARAEPNKASYEAVLAASALSIWNLARDASSNRFAADWSGPTESAPQIEADATATMALAAYAALLGAHPSDPTAASVLQAEEGTLHGVGLEAQHLGFEGWGYVAGWNADGQWVDFVFNATTAGSYVLDFRYAAGAGAASRLVFVNGQNAVANQTFAGTGAWGTYATAAVTVALAAGTNKISLIYNSSLGSTNYLNLDRVTIHP